MHYHDRILVPSSSNQTTLGCWSNITLGYGLRGAIKKFLASPNSVQNKIKIVFASYSSKAQNTTCTI